MSAVQTDVYSDFDMYCPSNYYGGYKEGRLLAAGDAERALSDWFTGDWVGSTYRFSIADHDAKLRRQLASVADRYWSRALTVRMTTRANRALLGRPYTIFTGPIIGAEPATALAFDITLGDELSHGMLSDRGQIPWRKIRDGFLNQLDAVSERLDLEQPEPQIYGIHTRAPGSAPSPEGFRITPIYLGIETLGIFGQYHVWLVAGHACKDVPAIYVDGVDVTDSAAWLSPGGLNWAAVIGGDDFVDKVSDTYGVDRRYCLIYGGVGTQPLADACALGDMQLTADVLGIEDQGDGLGDLIADIFQQYKHFVIQNIANAGPSSYMSGNWLTNPNRTIINGSVPVVDVTTFDLCSDIAAVRFDGNTGYAGYVGASVIGARAGDRAAARKWIADWNRSSGARFGVTADGRLRIVLLHPTEEARDAAILITDAYEVLQGSFGTNLGWSERVSSLAYKSDLDPMTSQWYGSGSVVDAVAAANYELDQPGDVRDYPFAPGTAQAAHLAALELAVRTHPPRVIRLQVPIGNPTGEAAYLDLGDYFSIVHFDAISETRTERLAWVTRHQVKGSARTVYIEAVDCEDLIDYDVVGSGGGSPGGSP